MHILSSGQAAVYAVQTPTGYDVERLDSGSKFSVSSRQISYLFAGCNDVIQRVVKSSSEGRDQALRTWCADRATRLFIILLDPDESPDELVEVGEALDDLLVRDGVIEMVEASLYSTPFDECWNRDGVTRALCGSPLSLRLMHDFIRLQEPIKQVRLSFNQLPDSLFEDDRARSVFCEAAIDAGCFRKLVLAATGSLDIQSALFSLYQDLRPLPNSRKVIQEWTGSFHRIKKSYKLPDYPEEVDYEPQDMGGGGGRQAFERALQQQQAIADRLKSADFETARRYARDMVSAQQRDSTAEHIAKSLTNISQRAKELNMLDIALEWAYQAVEVKNDDATAHAQLADIFMRLGRYAEAQQSLGQAEAYGEAGYAATGRARILRHQGLYADALSAYQAANEKFAFDRLQAQFNLAGIAECLRDLEDYDAALVAYDAAIAEFQHESALHAGRASTLVDMGRFGEALTSYQVASSYDRDNVIPKNGVAALYRRSGQLEKSEAEYRKLVALYQFDLHSRAGLIGVLRDTGRYQEALIEAKDLAAKLPASPDSFAILIGAQIDARLFDEALAALAEAVARFGKTVRFASASARVSKAKGEYGNALASLDDALREFPTSMHLAIDRADLLRKLGNDAEALKIYMKALSSRPDRMHLKNAVASILLNNKMYDELGVFLTVVEPKTSEEWRNFTLHRMLDVELGHFETAAEALQNGISVCPFKRECRFLRAALTRLQLKLGQRSSALQTAEDCVDNATELVKFRALAELEDKGPAHALYMRLVDNFLPEPYFELRDEIASQCNVVKMPAMRDRSWLLSREAEVLIQEAA